jgi:archaellum component FlaC
MGKKSKEFTIALEKVDISNEEALKKKVEDLEKQLERKTFEANFFKEQYELLLRNLQLRPNVEEL